MMPTSRATVELRREFCKDLCNALIMPGDADTIYPPWTKELALQMTRLGWTKGEPTRELL